MIKVVTGWHPEGYALYGKNFAMTFAKHWPIDVQLEAYVQQHEAIPRGRTIDVFVACDGLKAFIESASTKEIACGRTKNGYDFRFDAVKFCRQLFIPEAAARSMRDGEILCWLDGDVVTFRDVPQYLIKDQLLGTADVCYLGRDGTHSEIGFWAVKLSADTRVFLTALADMYRTGRVFELREWHSAFVFDHVRRAFEEKEALLFGNCTPGGRGHVWFQCELGAYTDHLKGPRKHKGRSPERRVG